MALQNFVARRLPTISAAWLNFIDLFANSRLTGVDTGIVNAYVVALPAGSGQSFNKAVGTVVRFTTPNTSTGASTLNVAGTGVASIVGQTGSSSSGGEILSTEVNVVQWTGTVWKTVGTGASPDKVRIAAETAASVIPLNYAYPPYNLLRYWSGSGDIDTAIASALSVCGSAGGRIHIPAGSYTASDASKWSLNQKNGVIIEGDGASTGGANNATIISFSGTGSSPWITMTSALGCQIRNLTLKHSSSSFTGAMIRCGNDGTHGDSFQCALIDVLMDAGLNTAYHLDLDKCINFSADRCYFAGGTTSVKGQALGGGSYSNAIKFNRCVWANTASVPINYGGQAWSFDTCTFEGVGPSGGAVSAGAFQTVSTAQCAGLTFTSCWLGDAVSGTGTWISTFGPGFVAKGNYFGGTGSSLAITLNSVGGAVIQGNDFDVFSIALSLATGANKGLIFNGNNFNSVTTPISGAGSFGDGPSSQINPNNPMVGASGGLAPFFDTSVNGYEWSRNGMLRQRGVQLVTAGTPVTITFPIAFTTFRNIQVTEVAPDAGITDVYVTAVPTTTQATLNARGAGNVLIHWLAEGI